MYAAVIEAVLAGIACYAKTSSLTKVISIPCFSFLSSNFSVSLPIHVFCLWTPGSSQFCESLGLSGAGARQRCLESIELLLPVTELPLS